MEVVKEHSRKNTKTKSRRNSFNPCFNGSCKRTRYYRIFVQVPIDCFNPCFNGSCKRTMKAEIDELRKLKEFQSLF